MPLTTSRRVLLGALSALVVLANAAPAHAASVSINTEYHYLVVLGGAAADHLSVSPGTAPGTLAVSAHGGPLTVSGSGCHSVDAGSAICTASLAGVYLGGDGGSDVLTLGIATAMPSYLVGGDGDDVLLTRDGVADRIDCGSGVDRVLADDADTPAPDCETVERPLPPAPPAPGGTAPGGTPGAALDPVGIPAALPAPAPVRIAAAPVTMSRSGVLRLAVSCPRSERHSCRGRLTLRLRGAQAAAAGAAPVIGRARFRARPGTRQRVRVVLSRNGRQRIIRRKKARCSVVARTPSAHGGTRVRAQDVIVNAPKGTARS